MDEAARKTLSTRCLAVALAALLAGCGASGAPGRPSAAAERLTFAYATASALGYVDHGRLEGADASVAVHDVSYMSEGRRIEGYLSLPRAERRRPAVVFVHGSGGDRRELLPRAEQLAARGAVTLTITEPSASGATVSRAGGPKATLRRLRRSQVLDVVAIRRAVDVLQSLPQVDGRRVGYLGWSAGARTGTFVAASEPRVKALVLLSAGASPIATYAALAPPSLRPAVREVLGSIDPLRYIPRGRPGALRLEDGTQDQIVPHAALLNVVHAAPKGTSVRWYDAPHQLNNAAYRDGFAWLMAKLAR
jgi:dienelactone hydrolase